MCRVEERVYIGADGNRSTFEDTYHCDKARNGRLCAKVKRRTTEYYPKKNTISRNDTPSPISPPTPVGTGNYLVQQRRPSSSGARPSTRDGPKAIKPEIIIEFGSKKDKNKVLVSSYKRSSLGTSSDEVAVESPGSDASRPIHTGFPEAPLPPQAAGYSHTDGYGTTPTAHHGYHHRHTSSTSSFTGSSRTPSLYVTSDDYDYDPPVAPRNNTRLPPAIHNPVTNAAPPSPSRPRAHGNTSSAAYNTTVIIPDTLFPMDSHDFADRSASSIASSGGSGQSRRGKDHDQVRKKKVEDRRRQEEHDRAYAEAIAKEQEKEENVKQVRFEIDRADTRAKQRAENLVAEKEKQRAIDRETARRRAEEDREAARRRAEEERELEAAKERKKEKEREEKREREREREREKERPKIHASNSSSKRPSASRRTSVTMTAAQAEEQRRLLAADLANMQGESRAAEAREREESLALLKQQQQDTSYYNPRVNPAPTSAPPLARRDSQSRRNSVSAEARPTLGRSNSTRRTSIIQPNPPPTNGHGTSGYQRSAPSARTHAPPPVSFPSNFNTRPPPARRPSFAAQDNPFAAPPTRGSNSSIENNPFATGTSVQSPVTIHQDPWDARYMRDALPNPKPITDSRHAKHRSHGADVHHPGSHSAAREATRAMGKYAGHDIDYVTDSDDDVKPTHGRKRY